MMTNRRYLIFRVSIFINIAVLLYAAMHLSERSLEFKYIVREDLRNESYLSARGYDDVTAAKTPSTMASTNRTTTSTMSIAEIEKKISILPSEAEATNETVLEIVDEDELSEATLQRLRVLLDCKDREFLPRTVQRGAYWVLENFVRADHGAIPCHETITYTSHAGYEFLDNVLPLIERWPNPVSLAIHAPGTDFQPALDSIRYLRDCTGGDLIRQYVTFHIFFSPKHIPSQIPSPEQFLQKPYNCPEQPPYANVTTTFKKEKNLLYPVNVARNIARDSALTHFILAADIELYPSRNLVPRFLNMIARNAKPLNTSKNPRVFPLSLFEVEASVQVPSTKTELQKMLAKKEAIPFHKFVCPTCHNIPKAKEWMKAKETNQMEVFHVGKRSGNYKHWEPIYIGTNHDPFYDEILSWDGKMDKMTQGYILCVRNYDFMILNNAFLIHKPGIKRYVKDPKRDKIAGKQAHLIKKEIMPQFEKLFGTRPGCML